MPTPVLQMTRDNHFKFGYDQNYFSLRKNPEQKWSVAYDSIARSTLNWQSECIIAAKEIAHSTQKKIYICLSGGIDSEVTAESFRLAQIPFTAAIMRFPDQLNQHDISWAENYCQQHQIQIEYFDIDLFEFYQSHEFKEIADSTNCFFPMLSLQMKLMDWVALRNGFPVVGSAECYLEIQPSGHWVFYEREIFASLYRYQMLKNFDAVCGFFQWNPEVMYSFLIDPMVTKLVYNEFSKIKSTLEIKQNIYAQHFQITPRPKYYGWEKFAKLESEVRNKLMQKFSGSQAEEKINYFDLIKMLNPRGLQ